MIARWVSLSGPGTTSDELAALATGAVVRVRRQVEGDRDEVGVGAGGVRRLEPRVELVQVEPALPRGLAQDLGDLVPLRVGDAQLRGVVLEISRHATQPSGVLDTWSLVADAEFLYSDLLPTGADDTPYRLITTEGVSTFEAQLRAERGPSSRSSPRRSAG